MAGRRTGETAGSMSRRRLARCLIGTALLLPLAACAGQRSVAASAEPETREQCIAKLRRMGQTLGKIRGRCV